MTESKKPVTVLALNTVAFTVCFAAWMMNGVLVTFLVDNGLYDWNKAEIGWLIGIPVLTGSLTRLPVGVLTDRFGGRIVYTVVMLVSAVPMWLLSYADGYWSFALGGLGFGLAGASFAVGIAYTSVWFRKERQGTALGIFGAGNVGAALTSMGAPLVLRRLTAGGLDGWRTLPRIYAVGLVVMAVCFWLFTHTRLVDDTAKKTLRQRLAPLGEARVWRFGLYYFFMFGGFVALAQWLIPYYVNVYAMSVATAGLMASIFTLPSGVIRAFGGWLSDRLGARTIMYWVLGASVLACAMLVVPRMDIQAPGQGIMSPRSGRVTAVGEHRVRIDDREFSLVRRPEDSVGLRHDPEVLILPHFEFWQEPAVRVGERVERKQLVARGITHIYFQANVWVFSLLVLVLGIAMGIGNAAVYKHIPDYFPRQVGVVGGIVGVLGGLGGFVGPIVFGYLLEYTGIWTTSWMFFLGLALACLVWMHLTIRQIMKRKAAPDLLREIEHTGAAAPDPVAAAVRDAGSGAVGLGGAR